MLRKPGEKKEIERQLSLLRLAQVLSFLLVFMAGIIIGLITSSHINRHFSFQSASVSTSNPAMLSFSPGYSNCTIVSACDEEKKMKSNLNCFSMDGFLRPDNLTHSMDDDELLWRASLVPYREEYPFDRLPKVAFMFLTRGPLAFLPLWEKFFNGHEKLFSIYVHTPPGYELNVSRDSPFYGSQIPSQTVEWGSVLLTDAEKRLLANALLDFSNERFILLSESCIPVYNFPTVYKYLIGSAHSFVDSYDEPTRYGRGRYNRKMLPDIKLHHWRKGSQWFEMNRRVAVHVISDTKYYAIFRKHCKPACYPDEHYLPTFLNMFHGPLNANRSVTWVNWSMGGPHPAMYKADDITKGFIESIRNNGTTCLYNGEPTTLCYLFARKFAPSALEPLLNVSSTVMEF